MTNALTIRTVLASPYDGTLYGSPYLWRDANYAYMTEPRTGWRPITLKDVPARLFVATQQLTPGEYNKEPEPMSTDDKYNGWTNWETWNTNLWMTNEEGLYGNARAIVREYIEDADEDADPPTPRTVDAYAAGKALAEWWGAYFAPDVDAAGPLADAWNATQGAVNWEEIAEGLAEE